MSIQLLKELNGNNTGIFSQFINTQKTCPRIAWYPSAGSDFRALLFLSPLYAKANPANSPEPSSPDLFLFTDYFPWENSKFLDTAIIHDDGRSKVTVEEIEELPKIDLPLHKEIVDFSKIKITTNRVVFMNVRIESKSLGTFKFPIVYIFSENEAFFCEKMLPAKAKISHIIHIRYGGGLGGGGKARGGWISRILKQVGCEVLVSDGRHNEMGSGDEFMLNYCKEANADDKFSLNIIRTVKSESWSSYGDVSWNVVLF
jgi:hypothetical protein